MNNPRVRFAPSPTGYLHIGGARTALFNWLFAKQNNGTFLLRIEDTDLERSKNEYIEQITEALDWLGLDSDEDFVLQSSKKSRHQECVEQMIQDGSAYRCFLQKDELDQLRDQAEKKKEIFRVPQTYRDFSLEQQEELINEGKSFTIRLKVPAGETVFTDLVYGTIKIQNKDFPGHLILLQKASAKLNTSSIFSNKIEIDEILIDGVNLSYYFIVNNKLQINDNVKSLQKTLNKGSSASSSSKKFVIKNLKLDNIVISAKSEKLNLDKSINFENLEFKNIGNTKDSKDYKTVLKETINKARIPVERMTAVGR